MSKDQAAMQSSHAFSLTKLKAECYYASITADFTPPPSVNKVSNSIMPAFLTDKNFFTPAFIVSREKEYYKNNFLFEKEKFQARILKADKLQEEVKKQPRSRLEILAPIPTSNYCQICKTNYTSYEDHLKETSHQRQSRFSKANTYINQLCKLYWKNKSRAKAKQKNKRIKKGQTQKYESNLKSSKLKKWKEQVETPQVGKQQNYSTNVPSVLPTPYC